MGTAASTTHKSSVEPIRGDDFTSSPRISSAPVKAITRSSSVGRRPRSGGSNSRAATRSRNLDEIKALRTPCLSLNQPEELRDNQANLKDAITRLTQQLQEEILARNNAEDRLKKAERQLLLTDGMLKSEKIAVLKAKLIELNSDSNSDVLGNTINVKDKTIERLEDEIEQLRNENTAIQEKYGRKVKKVRNHSAKKRAEASIEILALKEEINNLKRENTQLSHRLEMRDKQIRDNNTSGGPEADAAPGSQMLVLSLSAQIEELDEELRAAHATIAQLQIGKQNNS